MIPDNQNPDFVTDPEDRNTPLNSDSNETVDSENLNYDETIEQLRVRCKRRQPRLRPPRPIRYYRERRRGYELDL
jgi:hypothetical protein